MLKKINSSYKSKLILRIIIFLIITFGFISPLIFDGAPFASRYIMFTGLSNFVITIEYLLLIIFMLFKKDTTKKSIYTIRLISTGGILLTFFVFGLLLTPLALVTKEYNPFTLSSILQHFVNPILAILEFLLIDPQKEKVKKVYSFTPLSLSIIYTICIEIRGILINEPSVRTGGVHAKYPYFFFDPFYMGIFFEGGDLNVHYGVVPTIITLAIFHLLICFILLVIKNVVDKSYYKH